MKMRALAVPLVLLAALGCGTSGPPPSPQVTVTVTSTPAASPLAVETAGPPPGPPAPPAEVQPSPAASPEAPSASPAASASPEPSASPTEPPDSYSRRVEADGSTTITVRGKGAPGASPSAEPLRARTDLDPKAFRVPFYPKARVQGGLTRETVARSAILQTDDPFDAVVAFYRERMPGAEFLDSAAGPVRTASLTDEATEVSIQQGGDQPGTRITITARR